MRTDPRTRGVRTIHPLRPGIVCGALGGLLVAVISSAGILAERVARGDARVVMAATATAAVAAVLVLATTFRPYMTPLSEASGAAGGLTARPSRGPSRVIGAQALGALLGVAIVHLALRGSSLRACGWLCEEPRQLVNDLAAVFGALALVWGCVRRPVGPFATLAAVVIAALYALTSPQWHLDGWAAGALHGAFGSISVQIAVLVQIACTAVGVSTFHRLRVNQPPLGAG